MAASASFGLTGVSGLLLRMATVVGSIKRRVDEEVATTALLVETEAKRRCPVDTGRLRSSITTERKGLTLSVGSNVKYAPFIEFGTRRMAAQPFLFPAAESQRIAFVANLKAIIRL